MGKLHKAEHGFSSIELVLVGAVVVVLAVTGSLAYKHQHHTEHAHTAATNTAPQTQSGSTPTSTQYLDIKEWGVKLPLTTRIEDAYYVVPAGISNDEDGRPSAVDFGLSSLNASCGTVTADSDGFNHALGSIVRALPTDTDPVSGKYYTQLEPAGVTIGGYYYGYADAGLKGKTCTDSATIQSIDAAFSTAVRHAVTDSANN